TKSFFDWDGKALLGWRSFNGVKYYFDQATGISKRWSQKIDGSWYYFDGTSVMQKGWVTWKDGTKSYFQTDSSGRAAALLGWASLNGKKFYFNPANGISARWSQVIDGKEYYFDGEGVRQTGWITWNNDGSRSYFDPRDNGAMVHGTQVIDGVIYEFESDGRIREAIMGAPKTTVALMVRHFQASGRSYPADVYASKGAATLQQFCGLIYDEAVSEGVRPEVLYSQVMHETGYLQFGGDVKAEQCNFGGLGATGNGVRGEVFPDVRTGLRAQAQHLKAYGSTAALNNPCVDSRFQYVKRGCAPYVANLSGTWAADRQYGKKLLAILKDIVLY
ncbi:N-acetylmuramoyl-L-alanine amidase, partial [Enterorhabdus sp. NM05_H27]